MQGVLEGVHFIRVPTQIQMIATLQTLDAWLEAHPQVGVKERTSSNTQVKLVVIDTLSFHFRQPTLDLGPKKRIMDLYVERCKVLF